MTGPRPAGRPWTRLEDRQLFELLASGMTHGLIARKLKRTLSAVQSRTNTLKKKRRQSDLPERP
jgi:DNA-binding NarL/FixJ family response regulator